MPQKAFLRAITLILSLASCTLLDESPSDGSNGNTGSNGNLSVYLSATPTNGPAPLQVRFESSNATSASPNALDHTWQLANRTFTGGTNRSHTFTREGTFDVSVTVSDGQVTVDDVVTIQVGEGSGAEPGNGSPSIIVDASPTSGIEDLTVAHGR